MCMPSQVSPTSQTVSPSCTRIPILAYVLSSNTSPKIKNVSSSARLADHTLNPFGISRSTSLSLIASSLPLLPLGIGKPPADAEASSSPVFAAVHACRGVGVGNGREDAVQA